MKNEIEIATAVATMIGYATSKPNSLNDLAAQGFAFVEVWIDETSHWKDEIQKKAGKIAGVYLIDLINQYHACEMAVSYDARFVRSEFENESELDLDNNYFELVINNGYENDCLLRGDSVLHTTHKIHCNDVEMNDDAFDKAWDYVQGNHNYTNFFEKKEGVTL